MQNHGESACTVVEAPLPRHLVGCLVRKRGAGAGGGGAGSAGAGSAGVRGVVVECVPCTAPVAATALFRVEYADGKGELAEASEVRVMLADAGDGGAGSGDGEEPRCPVCFDNFDAGSGVRPSILECGHVFCIRCVQCIRAHSAADTGAAGTTRRGTCIRCPLCQARHRVRDTR